MTVSVNPSNQPSNALTTDMVTNSMPMTNSPDQIPSEAQVYLGDQAVLAVANTKTSVRYYQNGTPLNGTPNTGDIVVWMDTVTTSGGNAVIYLTSDHTSAGTAICSDIYVEGVGTETIDSSANYARAAAVVAGNKKSVTIPFNKQIFTGITLLSTNILGSVAFSAASGSTITVTLVGKAA